MAEEGLEGCRSISNDDLCVEGTPHFAGGGTSEHPDRGGIDTGNAPIVGYSGPATNDGRDKQWARPDSLRIAFWEDRGGALAGPGRAVRYVDSESRMMEARCIHGVHSG